MASCQETIDWLEKLPSDIAERGKHYVRFEIMAANNIRTGHMLNSVQGAAEGNQVRIRVWTHYASYVNDGRGPVVPRRRQTWKSRNKAVLHWSDPAFGEVFTPYAAPYKGSHFFDKAYEDLLGYIKSL